MSNQGRLSSIKMKQCATRFPYEKIRSGNQVLRSEPDFEAMRRAVNSVLSTINLSQTNGDTLHTTQIVVGA